MKNNSKMTAYCGIYCGDCIHFRNRHSELAAALKKELDSVEFDKYAEIKSSFGDQFKHYQEFVTVLDALITHNCSIPCRSGTGCSTEPCIIIRCCMDKGLNGCWECNYIEDCDKFEFLTPRCGDMPKNNLKKIIKYGLEAWTEHREKFYVWQ